MAFSITFVLFPNLTQLDMTAPAQILSRLPEANVSYAARTLDPVITDSGFSIMPTTTFEQVTDCDLMCVPGGFGVVEAMQDSATITFLKHLAERATYTTSVCTGALLLGAAGLLLQKRATTHWAYHSLLPLVGALPVHARVVRDGNVFTGGGVTAGIDFALTIAAEVFGEDITRTIATAVEYDPAPPYGAGVFADQSNVVQDTLMARYKSPVADTAAALKACLG